MADEAGNRGNYVPRAVEQMREYLARVVDENERLRLEVARRTSELNARTESAAAVGAIERENEYLKKMVALLEDRLRVLERVEFERAAEAAKLQHRLARLEAQQVEALRENENFSAQYRSIEKLHANLMNLYVTSYRLHASLDRQEVISAITETVINLVGSEDFVVYEAGADATRMERIAWFGSESNKPKSFVLDSGELSGFVRNGDIQVATPSLSMHLADGTAVKVVVPLRLGARTAGVLLILSLLPQKGGALEDVDLELFGLLATQAAPALYSTRLHQQFGSAQVVP